jgi:hypothetical protein
MDSAILCPLFSVRYGGVSRQLLRLEVWPRSNTAAVRSFCIRGPIAVQR